MNPEEYNKMVNDEAFLNEVFSSMDLPDRAMTLGLAGFDLEDEWYKYNQRQI